MLTAVLVVASCGGGSGSGSNRGGGSSSGPPPTTVSLSSDAGDFIGQGLSYSYSNLDAVISVEVDGAHLSVRVEGDQWWTGNFILPETYTELTTGTYSGLSRHPFHDPVIGGMSWGGEHRGCNQLTGTFVIESVTYTGSALTEIDLTFEQFCENGSAAIRGDIHWNANDLTVPPGPIVPPPNDLWAPATGDTPATGNYLYLESEPGDYIGGGVTYLYTDSTALLSINPAGNRLSVLIDGDERWTGNFQAMISLQHLEVGYYGELHRYPFHNEAKGGFTWGGQGRGCNELDAWFVVDSVTYEDNTLTAIELRFEQRCEGGSNPALHGALRWDANDSTGAPGPLVPPPTGLWMPEPGVTPEEGNFIYLDSDDDDFIGGGSIYLFTDEDHLILPEWQDARFSISVQGDDRWGGDFEGMNSLGRLEVGYYGDLQRYPFHNPAKGGLSWSGNGRGCNGLEGWFVVDSITYDGDELRAIDLRFGQHCEGRAPALHGMIHWVARELGPPGPVQPPEGLWEPAPGITPASGNYVYLESQAGDRIGLGNTYTYTLADSAMTAEMLNARLSVAIEADEWWRGEFQGKDSLAQLQAGYYGDLQHVLDYDPDRGGLHWYGESRGCGTVEGWFVVDSVTYNGPDLATIDLRFEQSCNYGPVLNGEIHWDVNDTTSPPGPVVPPPTGLWEPAPGTTPDTGNYVYLESDVGDTVGQGNTYLYTGADDRIEMHMLEDAFIIDINSGETSGDFSHMNILSKLEVGYYGNVGRYPFHNAVIGGMHWNHGSRRCDSITGWFVVDSISHEGSEISEIDLRFEQHCEGAEPALHGEIHWRSPQPGN